MTVRRRGKGSVAGLSRAQVAALMNAVDREWLQIPEPTARALERMGYLVSAEEGGRAWRITDRGIGAAAILGKLRRAPSTDKAALSTKTHRETDEVVDAVCRLIKSVGKRVAQEDTDALEQLLRLDAAGEEAWKTAIAGLRRTFSDTQIGNALGVKKQAVQQRWPRAGTKGELV